VQTLKDFVRKNSALTSASYATKAEVAICNQVRKAWEVKTQKMSDELDMVALGNNNNNNIINNNKVSKWLHLTFSPPAKLWRDTRVFSDAFDEYVLGVQFLSKVEERY
jgi:hypothetical protein